MGLLGRSLAMLFLLICFSWLPDLNAQSTNGSSISNARALDALLQDYAYRAFRHPKTGIPFDGAVPSNLTGIKVSGMRLRSGSLYRRGVDMYKEFKIPTGVTESQYVERLVLVYQNLGNWSETYYPLVGHTYVAPVLGLLAYDASNLSATNLQELDIRASLAPISIIFPDVKAAPSGIVAKCVRFDLNGSVNYSGLLPGNTCSTVQQGHFSIVFESIAPSPQPVSPSPTPNVAPPPGKREEKNNSKIWIIIGSVVGGLALLVLSAFLVLWVQKYKQRKKMQRMERAAEVGEALHMTSVGNTRAPAATGTRTQPVLESELVP
ncbi:uncharacterized protein LOC107431422 [Ziziphus jujuba]|uniref:Uncharacterized protein LOC107431422 n=2 Tax=Ziziphus jujuba TaxID=326968 RepID=A0A6P4AJE8_ZIZJJ|nr:uncharacterized protein LOC107431422 [Ziziphus jujuba]XP_015897811.1 uncharacterized protein LOC107431422 [Ziziphus jujuba]KAH7515129.1 hypothetical protein FEM48_Zijuj11G0163200 [Ziziphus jujuba var. spinosa]